MFTDQEQKVLSESTNTRNCETGSTSSGEDSSDESSIENVDLDDQEMQQLEKLAFSGDWMTTKPMTKWSEKELMAWTLSQQYNDMSQKLLRAEVCASDVVKCKSADEIASLMKISLPDAEELHQALNKRKRHERMTNNSNSTNSKEQNSTQAYILEQLSSREFQSKSIRKWTAKDTRYWLRSLQMKPSVLEGVLAVFEASELDGEDILDFQDYKTMSLKLDIVPSAAKMVMRAAESQVEREMELNFSSDTNTNQNTNGEGDEVKYDGNVKDQGQQAYRARERTIRVQKYKSLRLSSEPDIIMGYTEEDGIPRAEMPCGHAIASDTMYFYLCSIFEKHLQRTRVFCPLETCAKEWNWFLCLQVADMTDNEQLQWNGKRNKRLALDFRECPYCKRMCEKDRSHCTLRVSCQCGKGVWCWSCRGSWKSASTRICGNKNCTAVKSINSLLRECGKFRPLGLKVEVPLIRACPMCMTFIYHDVDSSQIHHCKHISCAACKDPKVEFCFVCLKQKLKNGRWQCGGALDECPTGVAPIQQFL